MFRTLYAIRNTATADTKPIIAPPASISFFPTLASRHGSTSSSVRGSSATSSVKGETTEEAELEEPADNSSVGELELEPVESELEFDSVFAIAIDPKARGKTIAGWQVDTPEEIINLLLKMGSV
jgi:hypothetical protein